MMRKIIIICLLLSGCMTAQTPNQTTINYTDNSQIIQIVGDNNNTSVVSDTESQQISKPEQSAEQTTKNGMWIFWLIVFGVITLGCVFLYLYLTKWRK